MKTSNLFLLFLLSILGYLCKPLNQDTEKALAISDTLNFNYNNEKGCDGRIYPDPATSEYVLPYLPGTSYTTGLTNCSSSYHGADFPDRYAFDFDMVSGDPFYAARAGVVVYVENSQSSEGGGGGNRCIIDHLDNTYGVYLHSPKNGIYKAVGDTVKQGELIGKVGKSGLAGYPHLHFIVVQNGYNWPYDPVPITFRNASPADVILKSHTQYMACKY